MADAKQKSNKSTGKAVKTTAKLRCSEIAERGIESGPDFARFCSQLISDVISQRIDYKIANVANKSAANLLKITELQLKASAYSKKDSILMLTA